VPRVRGAGGAEWIATPPPLEALQHGPLGARIGNVRVGTASWTERTLVASGDFYPPVANSPERRLRYYARHFSVVEVDATYYALPQERMAAAWVERTPPDFRFGVKAYAAITEHPFEPKRLDRDLQAALPEELRRARRVYPKDLPSEVSDEIFARFARALVPLREAGKLAYVLLQMPPWFAATRGNARVLEAYPARLAGLPLAVEFRRADWLAEDRRERTLALLRGNGLTYVSVDEPQGTPHSVPPIAEVTTPSVAVVRLHGRRRETWTKPGVSTTERFGYLYTGDELREWVPRVRALARGARDVHVLLNNCRGSSAVRNAKELAGLLES
jgi:uncharacterized protein YecE (DUF72 family)